MLRIVGDLCSLNADYICHQCNCVTSGIGMYLAKTIFTKFPYANVYKDRNKRVRDTPGTICIKGDGRTERYIINMFAQYYPNTARYPNDSTELRQKWFLMCLDKMAKCVQYGASVAFPERIGCNSAGGDWNVYYAMITKFAMVRPDLYVILCALPK